MPGWPERWLRRAAAPALVFSAQGGQWAGMGRALLAREPAFRDAVRLCDAVVRELAGWSPAEELERGACARHDRVQPALTTLQVALGEALRARGVRPGAVAGLSMGEAAAAHAAGALSLEDALRVVCVQARLTGRALRPGGMAFVSLAPDAAAEWARGEPGVAVAVELSPRLTVLSGEAAGLERIVGGVRARGAQAGVVHVGFAFHSPEVAPLEDEFRDALRPLRPRPAALPLYSSVRGGPVGGEELDAGYWWRIMSGPARFAPMVRRLLADGHDVLLEVGPHPTLAEPVRDTAREAGRGVRVLGVMTRGGDERRELGEAVAALRRSRGAG